MLGELRAAQESERAVDRSTFRVDGTLSLLTAVIAAVALYSVSGRIAAAHGQVGDLAVLVAALAGVQGSLAGILAQVANAGQVLIMFGHYDAIVRTAPRPGIGSSSAPVPALRQGIRFDESGSATTRPGRGCSKTWT